jgi:hypothetical protein
MKPWKGVAVLFGVLVLGLIFFPIFAQPARYNGLLVDRNGNRIPDADVVFVNNFGEELSRGRTTSSGHFYSPGTTDTPAKVRGFVLTRIIRSTGGTDRCVYSPAERMHFKLVDATGSKIPVPGTLLLTKSRGAPEEINFIGEYELAQGPSAARINRDFWLSPGTDWAQVRATREVVEDGVEYTVQVRKKELGGAQFTELNLEQVDGFMAKARGAPAGHIAAFDNPSNYRKFVKSMWGCDARFTGVFLRNPQIFAVVVELYEQDWPPFPPLESFKEAVAESGGEIVGIDALQPVLGPDGKTPMVYPSGWSGARATATMSFATEAAARAALPYIHTDYDCSIERRGNRWFLVAQGEVEKGAGVDEYEPFAELAKALGGKMEYVESGSEEVPSSY